MSFIVTMSNSTPATTEVVFGTTEDFKSFMLDLDKATPDQQKVCADFLALAGAHTTVNVINSDHNFQDCNYIMTIDVPVDIEELDYNSLSKTNKGKVNAFANLLISLAQ